MAETIIEGINLEEFEMKEETVFNEEILPSSILEDTCSVYTQREEIKKEECEVNEEMGSIKDETNTYSTVEDTCTVYVQDTCTVYVEDTCTVYVEDTCSVYVQDTCSVYVQGGVKMENAGNQGNNSIIIFLNIFKYYIVEELISP